MEQNSLTYQTYVAILKRELVPAMGCTEPIAVAYCAAKARAVLGCLPQRAELTASGNIIKNVKSVIVPNTNGRRGLAAAAGIGMLAGDEMLGLQVISQVPEEKKAQLGAYLDQTEISVRSADSGHLLDIAVRVFSGAHEACVRIADSHTNIILISRDGEILLDRRGDAPRQPEPGAPDYGLLNMRDIYDFAQTAELSDVKELLDRQMRLNRAISDEGLRGNYGANIGKVLLAEGGNTLRCRAKAAAAAGSDARMNGCELPVVINSGSGNQGMTASLPVMEYARGLGCSDEQLYRALLISNLATLHQKTGIGRLSAYCGAVSAGAGAGAGIAYLQGGGYEEIIHTVVNALAITSGIVCDGAKSSCAAKIAMAVEAGIFGYEMYRHDQQFYGGDGIVASGVENTIRNVGRLGRIGMSGTDREIISIMTE